MYKHFNRILFLALVSMIVSFSSHAQSSDSASLKDGTGLSTSELLETLPSHHFKGPHSEPYIEFLKRMLFEAE